MAEKKKLWGGRFVRETDRLVEEFNSSIEVDQRLYRQDILGSIAHVTMLGEQKILPPEEAELIVRTLQEILADIEAGRVEFSISAEDIHMNIESLLIDRLGEIGKKVHTARSRNDQVALDCRFYLKQEINNIRELLRQLQKTLLDLAEEHLETIMPGYTHLQKAQPVTLAHHLLAYVQMFARDEERLGDCLRRTDVMPLGSGALAGTTFPLNRWRVAEILGFSAISENSLDAVSDRDFAIEFTAAASIIMMHLSRFCEELILWSTEEFGFIVMDDAYTTGSSIMPQKKNPDVAELIRGKTGRVYGDLMALLTIMKALPLAYNKDMQEDKAALFDAVDTVKQCLEVFIPLLKTMRVRRERMRAAAAGGFANATDLADYLVRKGLPFRSAHEAVGRLVLYCSQQGRRLEDLSLEEAACESGLGEGWFEQDIYEVLTLENMVQNRRVEGGPSPTAVKEAIARARQRLS